MRVSSSESGLLMETFFLCFQIRSLDKNRFADSSAGRISETKMAEIEASIRYCLGF